MLGGLGKRDPAPKEIFARSQLVAISSIFMAYPDLHGFQESDVWRTSWQTGSCPLKKPLLAPTWLLFHLFIDFIIFSWISGVGCLAALANGILPLKKPLPDPSWLLFHGFQESGAYRP